MEPNIRFEHLWQHIWGIFCHGEEEANMEWRDVILLPGQKYENSVSRLRIWVDISVC